MRNLGQAGISPRFKALAKGRHIVEASEVSCRSGDDFFLALGALGAKVMKHAKRHTEFFEIDPKVVQSPIFGKRPREHAIRAVDPATGAPRDLFPNRFRIGILNAGKTRAKLTKPLGRHSLDHLQQSTFVNGPLLFDFSLKRTGLAFFSEQLGSNLDVDVEIAHAARAPAEFAHHPLKTLNRALVESAAQDVEHHARRSARTAQGVHTLRRRIFFIHQLLSGFQYITDRPTCQAHGIGRDC